MATPPPPPSPPSSPPPPNGDGTPDGGNPAHTAPPDVKPKPGRQSARAAGGDKKPTTPRPPRSSKPSDQASAAPEKPTPPRAPTPRRAAARPRPRPGSPSIAAASPSTDSAANDRATGKRGRWWKALAGGLGVLATGAALLSLRGGSRRKPKAHQADGTDSSKSFDAGIADEGTVPE